MYIRHMFCQGYYEYINKVISQAVKRKGDLREALEVRREFIFEELDILDDILVRPFPCAKVLNER